MTTPRTEQQRAKRNLNPHKPAKIAMVIWGSEYAAQRGGSMDFWDSLPEYQKDLCRDIVLTLENTRPETAADKAGL